MFCRSFCVPHERFGGPLELLRWRAHLIGAPRCRLQNNLWKLANIFANSYIGAWIISSIWSDRRCFNGSNYIPLRLRSKSWHLPSFVGQKLVFNLIDQRNVSAQKNFCVSLIGDHPSRADGRTFRIVPRPYRTKLLHFHFTSAVLLTIRKLSISVR